MQILPPRPSSRIQPVESDGLPRYFEPTEEERAQNLKIPTTAHRAIAKLIAAGYIRVVVTTNFDRLLELALQDVGIVPPRFSPRGIAATRLPCLTTNPQSKSYSVMKLRQIVSRFARLDLNKAARKATALKEEFRRNDEELYRQGRADEVLADRMKSLGISNSGSTRLLTVNGVKIMP